MIAQPTSQNPPAAKRPIPRFVPLFNPIGRRLAAAGLMGPNILLTVAGRKSGLLRSTPVAMVAANGKRWIVGTFGEVAWVLNLRAAKRGAITVKGKLIPVAARELSPTEGGLFFRDVLAPYATRLPIGSLLLRLLGASDILSDPEGAARRRPVFELTEAAGQPASGTSTTT